MTPDTIDYQKYKRLFTFGCSFTNSGFPTWANLLAKEMPKAEFYNYGMSGAGNQYIACRVSEINQVYNFDENDLVIILWSTFSREDRFIKGKWESHGSVYHAEFYSGEFVKKYYDPIGSVVRDFALMDLTNQYLKSLPCDYYDMLSVFPDHDNDGLVFLPEEKEFYNEHVLPKYKHLLDKYTKSYYQVYPWNDVMYTNPGYEDSHPNPTHAYNFLIALGFKLSEETKQYCEEETKFLKDKNRTEKMSDRYQFLNYSRNYKKTFENKYGH